MALRVWLPLNGTLENQGISNIKANVQSGVVVDNNGKIGKCYTNSGTSVNVAIPFSFITKQFSLCAWVKINTRRNNWCRAFGLSGSGNYIGLGCEHTNGTSFGFHFYKTIDGTNTSVFDTYPLTFSTGTWAHFLMAYDGTKYYVYKDGTLIASANASKTNIEANMNTLYLFGGTANNYSLCSLNDVRIYDHCLSAAEVHEISQGLVLHYKLDNQYNLSSSIQNKYNPPYSDGQSSGGSFTRTQLTNERGYNYTYTATGTGSNSWPNWYVPYYSFTPGKKYYYSVKIRCNKWTAGNMSIRAARSSNDYGGCDSKVICSNALADGKWHEYVVSQVINETYVRSGTTVTCNPRMEFYCSNLNGNGTLYDFDFDVKDVQVVESDNYIPFIDNSLANNIIQDSSGYNRNGTITGTLSLTSDTPRYSASTKFSSGSYITHPQLFTMYHATYSFWVKEPSFTAYGAIYSPTGSPSNGTTPWFSANTESSSVWAYFGGNSPNYTKGSGSLSTNTWYHCVYVWNNGVAQWYLNGVATGNSATYTGKTYIQNTTTGSLGDSYTGTSWSGTPFTGQLSDFRIYCTALSATDIKQLYEVGAKVDNKHGWHTFEYIDENSKETITKTGKTMGHNIIETYIPLYDKNIYTEPDGSKWIHIFHHNNPTGSRFDSPTTDWLLGKYMDTNRWYDVDHAIYNSLSPYEFMVKQKTTSSAAETKYRWKQTANPLTATWDNVKPGTPTFITTSGYTSSSMGGMYLMKSSNLHMCIANGSNGNWFGGIGAASAYQNGIPGYPNTTITDGYIDLYMRVYSYAKIIKNIGINANNLIEL